MQCAEGKASGREFQRPTSHQHFIHSKDIICLPKDLGCELKDKMLNYEQQYEH